MYFTFALPSTVLTILMVSGLDWRSNSKDKDILTQHWIYIFFFFFGCTHGIQKFPGQVSNPSHSCNPLHICTNATALTHCAGLGIKPVPLQRQARSLINPLHHSRHSIQRLFLIVRTRGMGSHWHLVGRDLICWKTSYNAQEPSPNPFPTTSMEDDATQYIIGTENDKSCCTLKTTKHFKN